MKPTIRPPVTPAALAAVGWERRRAARRCACGIGAAIALLGLVLPALQACSSGGGETSAAVLEGDHQAVITPQVVDINLLYGGATVHVQGKAAPEEQVAVLLRGPAEHLELKKIGKVWGLLWMSTGSVTLEHVPSTYLISTTAPLGQLAPAETLRHEGLGFTALEGQIEGDREAFGELLKLKRQEGMYRISEGDVARSGATFTATLPLPPKAPPGRYQVSVVRFTKGAPHLLAQSAITLRYAGVVQSLRQLALDHSLAYGCTAVLIALVAGLITGLIFGKQSGKGH